MNRHETGTYVKTRAAANISFTSPGKEGKRKNLVMLQTVRISHHLGIHASLDTLALT
jgi:hypothetical protein